jgi:hypothetical protein
MITRQQSNLRTKGITVIEDNSLLARILKSNILKTGTLLLQILNTRLGQIPLNLKEKSVTQINHLAIVQKDTAYLEIR